jgi:hypothetical protein
MEGAARATRAVVASYGSMTTMMSPMKLWYYMAGGGRGEPVVIPHPDDDNARSANANDDDNAPPAPPKKNNGNTLRGEGDGMTTVPNDDVTVAVASRDTVLTNAMSTVGCRGVRNLHAAADGMGGFMIMSLVSFDCRVGLGHDGGLDGGGGAGQRRSIVQQ